jgi:hypothetical protein
MICPFCLCANFDEIYIYGGDRFENAMRKVAIMDKFIEGSVKTVLIQRPSKMRGDDKNRMTRIESTE